MITYKVIPNSGMSKTGLAASFSPISSSKVGIKITAGSLTKGGEVVLPADVDLELDAKVALDVNFIVMLANKVADNSKDIVITQYTSKTRGVPPIITSGYELIEVLGQGKIPAGTVEPDFTEFVWA